MLRRELDGDTEPLESFLAIQINNLCDAVNLNEQLTFSGYQVNALACTLIELFPVESLEDFVLCFRRGALGLYGKFYRLDASVLCDWMQKYLDEKYQLIEVQATQANPTEAIPAVEYEAFKARTAEVFKPDNTIRDIRERERKERELQTPHDYYNVENLKIYATSQQDAERIVQERISKGHLVRETK